MASTGEYLPKDEVSFTVIDDDGKVLDIDINKTVLRWVWPNDLIHPALSIHKGTPKEQKDPNYRTPEQRAKKWFKEHPDMHEHFRKANVSIFKHIKEWQKVMKETLEQEVLQDKVKEHLKIKESEIIKNKLTIKDKHKLEKQINFVPIKEEEEEEELENHRMSVDDEPVSWSTLD